MLRRLERIEVLEREGATTPHLLGELRALLSEAEAWVRAEGDGTDEAEEALDRCRDALERQPVSASP